MVRLKLTGLPQGEKILATDWQVSDSHTFDNILLTSDQDEMNIETIVFQDNLDVNKKWYGRARILIDGKGYTEWGNIDIDTPENIIDLNKEVFIEVLHIDSVTTDSVVTRHSINEFTILLTVNNATSKEFHKKTSYVIEELNSDVVFSNLYDSENKLSYRYDGNDLEENHAYRLKIMIHGEKSSSDFHSVIFITGSRDIVVVNDIKNLDHEKKINIQTFSKQPSNKFTFIIKDSVTREIVFNGTTLNGNVILPINTLKSGKLYYIYITTPYTSTCKFELTTK